MLLRMRAHPLAEVREYADLMLVELRKVIPAFLKRVDLARPRRRLVPLPGRDARGDARRSRRSSPRASSRATARRVTLTDYDPLGEEKVVAAAMYASSDLPDDRLQSLAHTMSADERDAVLRAYVGERGNRRHKPGRAFERTGYRFDVLCDYGAFRDLQRHRPAHARVAAAVARARVRHAGGDRRRRDDRRVGPRDGGLGRRRGPTLAEHAGEDVAQYAVVDGVPDPVRDADERPRGDAPDRAPLVAAGPPDLPAGRAADARPDRQDGRPPRDRRAR